MNTFLVTGATGFVGSNLVHRLINQKARVHIIVRKNATLWRIKDVLSKVATHIADLSDTQALSKIVQHAKPNVIYHLATYGAYPQQDDGDVAIQTNIQGTWNLLKATENHTYDIFVNTGSSSEYGFKDSPMKETDVLEPASYYATTKSAQTLMCMHEAKKKNKPIVTLRPFSVYGHYEEPTRLMPHILHCLYTNTAIELAAPTIARDYVYIDDVLNAYLSIEQLKKFPGEIFNIGSGIQTTLQQLIQTVFDATNKTIPYAWNVKKGRKWDSTTWIADIAKAQKYLGWKPRVSLHTGLLQFWQWYRNNRTMYTDNA